MYFFPLCFSLYLKKLFFVLSNQHKQTKILSREKKILFKFDFSHLSTTLVLIWPLNSSVIACNLLPEHANGITIGQLRVQLVH